MEDLNAASLDDVKAWFTNYYGFANGAPGIRGTARSSSVIRSPTGVLSVRQT
jgi:hypothetical protein